MPDFKLELPEDVKRNAILVRKQREAEEQFEHDCKSLLNQIVARIRDKNTQWPITHWTDHDSEYEKKVLEKVATALKVEGFQVDIKNHINTVNSSSSNLHHECVSWNIKYLRSTKNLGLSFNI
jgi:hypothetical protein